MSTVFAEHLSRFLTNDIMPNGYKKCSLVDIAQYLNGLALQEFPPESEGFLPVLKIRELRQGFWDSNSDHCSSSIPSDMIITNGTIIFSWSGSLLVDIWCGGTAGLNQHLFKVTSSQYPDWLIYLWTKYHLQEFIRIAEGKKTSMGHIKREDLQNAVAVVPDKNGMSRLSEYFMPIYNHLIENKRELQALLHLESVMLAQLSR